MSVRCLIHDGYSKALPVVFLTSVVKVEFRVVITVMLWGSFRIDRARACYFVL